MPQTPQAPANASFDALLASLHEKVQRLSNRCIQLELDLIDSQEAQAEQRNQMSALKQKLKHFQNQPKFDKLAEYLAPDDTSAQALVAKIDEYVREIDKCIAYLKE